MSKIKVTFYIEQETNRKLKKLSFVSGMTQAQLAEDALNVFFKTPKQSATLEKLV